MPKFTASVLTISDSGARGLRQDVSGPEVKRVLEQAGFEVLGAQVVTDDQPAIEQALIRLCSSSQLVVTTGGTGIARRDVTPEATLAVADRLVEGVAERMRAEGGRKAPAAILSRAVCAVRGSSLILNLPGSPRGAVEFLTSVIDVIPHALDLLDGNTVH
jgi:molybdenum cofactor synthesis domain-containing protein